MKILIAPTRVPTQAAGSEVALQAPPEALHAATRKALASPDYRERPKELAQEFASHDTWNGSLGNVFIGKQISTSYTQSVAVQSDAAGIEHLDGLYSYALVLTRNHSEAEDLVQETYVRAIQAMGRLRADNNMKGWLLTILRNIWLNQLRKRRTGPQIINVEDGGAAHTVELSWDSLALYISKIETEQVREAIQKLPIEFRDIILLREYEELSYQEITNVLDCPAGTVMSRLARARTKLRVLLCAPREPDRSGKGDRE
jgi:RNA polymerase sigma-70 factor, ECF subfamily